MFHAMCLGLNSQTQLLWIAIQKFEILSFFRSAWMQQQKWTPQNFDPIQVRTENKWITAYRRLYLSIDEFG